MQRLSQSDLIVLGSQVLTFDEYISVPVLSCRRPMPHVRRHSVKNGHWVRTHRSHCLHIGFIESLNVPMYRLYWVCVGHVGFPSILRI